MKSFIVIPTLALFAVARAQGHSHEDHSKHAMPRQASNIPLPVIMSSSTQFGQSAGPTKLPIPANHSANHNVTGTIKLPIADNSSANATLAQLVNSFCATAAKPGPCDPCRDAGSTERCNPLIVGTSICAEDPKNPNATALCNAIPALCQGGACGAGVGSMAFELGKADSGVKEICNGLKDNNTCKTCIGSPNCNYVETYTTLCNSVPNVPQCEHWRQVCSSMPESNRNESTDCKNFRAKKSSASSAHLALLPVLGSILALAL